MNIPVFRLDDQHGTAIIQYGRILNGLRGREKYFRRADGRLRRTRERRQHMNLLVALGIKHSIVVLCATLRALFTQGREAEYGGTKAAYAVDDSGKRTLDEGLTARIFSSAVPGPKC